MQKNTVQSKIIWLMGTFIIPIILLIPVFLNTNENYTGLLANEKYGIYIKLLFMILLVYLSYLANLLKLKKFHIFIFLAICTLLFPWTKDNPFSNSMHLIFAYSSFIMFNAILIQKYFYNQNFLIAIFLILLFSFFLCITNLEVTLLAEAIYGVSISIILVNIR